MSTVYLDYQLKKRINSPVHQAILHCVAEGINQSQQLCQYLNLFAPYRLEEALSDLISSGLLEVDNVTLYLQQTTAYSQLKEWTALKTNITAPSVLKSAHISIINDKQVISEILKMLNIDTPNSLAGSIELVLTPKEEKA